MPPPPPPVHASTFSAAERLDWLLVAATARHLANQHFPVYPHLTSPGAVASVTNLELHTLQNNLEQHADVITSACDDRDFLAAFGLTTDLHLRLFRNLAAPVRVSCVLVAVRDGGGVVRTMAGRYYLVRGHSKSLAELFQSAEIVGKAKKEPRPVDEGNAEEMRAKKAAVVDMVLLRCAFGGLTHSGCFASTNTDGVRRALEQFYMVPPPPDAHVLTEATEAQWDAACEEEKVAVASFYDEELATVGVSSRPRSLMAGIAVFAIAGYNAVDDTCYQMTGGQPVKVGDICPCGSGREYASCHRDKGQMPVCALKYPSINAERRGMIFRGEDAEAFMTRKVPEMEGYLHRTSSYEAGQDYAVDFQMTDIERVVEQLDLFCASELVMRPRDVEERPDSLMYLMPGCLRLCCNGPNPIFGDNMYPPGHFLAGTPAKYFTFRSITIYPEKGRLQLYAMSWTCYKHLLKLIKDCGAAQYLSAGSLKKTEKLCSIRTTDKSLMDDLDTTRSEKGRSSKAGQTQLQKLHLSTRCSGCGGDNGGEKLLVCGNCKKRFYCSRVCQSNDWSAHKKICKLK